MNVLELIRAMMVMRLIEMISLIKLVKLIEVGSSILKGCELLHNGKMYVSVIGKVIASSATLEMFYPLKK